MRWGLVLCAAVLSCGGAVSPPEAKTAPDGSMATDGAPPTGPPIGVDGGMSVDSGDCEPPLESCDQGSPVMNQVDTVRDCILPLVQLTSVCLTSVNRCAASAGVQEGCAFAPDGGVFVGGPADSDNNILTAQGWRFVQYGTFPSTEVATLEEEQECAAASCFPLCPGTPKATLYCLPPANEDSGTVDAAYGCPAPCVLGPSESACGGDDACFCWGPTPPPASTYENAGCYQSTADPECEGGSCDWLICCSP